MKTLDMRLIRYLNLFERITGVSTKNCFFYNNMVIFAVPGSKVSKAIGRQGRNVKKISEIIKRNIKIIAMPRDEADVSRFISDIVAPVSFKSLEYGDEIVISASSQSKASLIGRNKVRLKEIKDIIKQYFDKELRIV